MSSRKSEVKLDAGSSEPLYKQIKQLIVSKIDAGLWRPGDRISTELRLVDELNASRMTVNRALRELTQEGVLQRRQGSGTFVSPARLETGLLEIRNIAEVIEARGNIHSSRLLALTREKPPTSILRQMLGSEGEQYFHSVSLHFENRVPLQLEDRYVNPDLVPEFLEQDFTQQTTGGYLLKNIPYSHVDHKITAALSTPEQQKLLQLEASEPVLILERLTYCAEGVITAVKLFHPAHRFEFSGTFTPDRTA